MTRTKTCTISEAKKEVANIVKAYLSKYASGQFIIPEKDRIPAILTGPPGIGKTEIVSQVAKESGIGFVSYSLAHHTRSSLLGLPVIITSEDGKMRHTEYTMSELVAAVDAEKNLGHEAGILFLDEFNCMSDTIAPAMLSLLQQKKLGNYKLPEGWLIMLAGNPAAFNKSAKRFDMATMDRIRVIEIAADVESYLEYASEVKIHERIQEFIRCHKSALYYYDSEHLENVVTPRGWTNLSSTLKANELLGIETSLMTIRQFIRCDRIATAFSEYMNRADELISRADLESVYSNGRNGAFEECVGRLKCAEDSGNLDYVAKNICDFAVERSKEIMTKFGIKTEKISEGLEYFFELFQAFEQDRSYHNARFSHMLADRISENELLIKYASHVEIPGYSRMLSRLDKAIATITQNVPEFSYVFESLGFKETGSDINISTDGRKLIYNPRNVTFSRRRNGLSQIQEQLLHVILHYLRGDILTYRKVAHKELFSAITDAEVYELLTALKRGNGFYNTKNTKDYYLAKYDRELTARIISQARGKYVSDDHSLWLDHKKDTKALIADREKNLERIFGKEASYRILVGTSCLENELWDRFGEKSMATISKCAGTQSGNEEKENALHKSHSDYKMVIEKLLSESITERESFDNLDRNLYCYGLDMHGDIPFVEPGEDEVEQRQIKGKHFCKKEI